MKKLICFVLFAFSCACAQEPVVFQPEINIVGIACRTSNDNALVDIPLHWARFFSEDIAEQIPNKATDEIVALYCEYEGDHTMPYTLVIGCKTKDFSDVPEGFVAKTIPASHYVQYTATGTFPDSLIQTWGQIWQSNLPRSYSGDFEVYGEEFLGPNKQVDVFIAIQE